MSKAKLKPRGNGNRLHWLEAEVHKLRTANEKLRQQVLALGGKP